MYHRGERPSIRGAGVAHDPGIGEQLPSLADLLGRPFDERTRRSGVPGGTPLAWWSDDRFGWLRILR
jgi:hypothetical protein